MIKLGDDDYTFPSPSEIDPSAMPFSCKWILSVLNKAISKTNASLDSLKLSDAATAVYSWWRYQLCDVFIELIKPYFWGGNNDASSRRYSLVTLCLCLENGLILLHPLMPFITEELWQYLTCKMGSTREESIVISEYPTPVESWYNDDVEVEMEKVESVAKH